MFTEINSHKINEFPIFISNINVHTKYKWEMADFTNVLLKQTKQNEKPKHLHLNFL